jgi:hypothetical protein
MAQSGYDAGEAGYDRGEGWLGFAAVILLIVGVFNVVLGITLIANDEIYVTGPESRIVLIGDVTLWGWVLLVGGFLEILAGVGVPTRNQLARWFGIVMASLAAIAHLPVIFGPRPLFSFLVVLLCVAVIYGLSRYGGREPAAL